MNAKDAVILWTPNKDKIRDAAGDNWGSVKIVRHPAEPGDAGAYFCSGGADRIGWTEMQPAERLNAIFLTYLQMTLVDGIAPLYAHEALCEIAEYRKATRAYVPVPHRLENAPDGEDESSGI